MTTKVVNAYKFLGFLCLVFLTLVSCEKEIESIGVDLVDNSRFNSNVYNSDVTTATFNIENVPANGVSQYLLGVYSDSEFGTMAASIVSQLSLPTEGATYNYGEETVIDSVLMSIPYQVTRLDDLADGKPNFQVDSVIGNLDNEFKINVYELKTFLNELDPTDPTKRQVYYSDKEFQRGTTPFFSGAFQVNPNDTVTYINRLLPNGTAFDRDTIYEADKRPAIKLPLDEDLVKQLFVDNASSADFATFENFLHYFRGFYIQSEVLNTPNSHLISLDMASSKMTIYFSNVQDEDEGQDLNGNGVNGEENVRVKQRFEFLFGNLKSNVIERDYTNDQQSGADRLYVQGAAGSIAKIDLFANQDLNEIRSKNWLITGANLIFYIDPNASSDIIPERLFLYNYDEDVHVRDVLTEGPGSVGGTLERDENGDPYRYVFRITDYISEVLKSDDALSLNTLGLKVFNPSDEPSSPEDAKVKKFSWNPKGVVLFNHDAGAGDKRVTLQLFYTELTN